MSNKTLMMIKPDAVQDGHVGNIIKHVTDAGFKILGMKLTQLTLADAQQFYEVHDGKPFFETLTTFMSSGPIVAIALEKENAIADYRTLIGATNPEQAAEGTIRKLYARSMQQNAVHGSDSDENAAIEIAFHFSGRELF